jgi:phenylalanyl-tRNA synthetase beta chain
MYGYDRIPLTNMADELPEQRANVPLERENKIRDVLVGAGLDEVITYSLTSMESVAKVNPADADTLRYLKLSNPLTSEREYLRRSLLPTLLEALVSNVAEREKTALFEIGHVYLRNSERLLPDEPLYLAIVLAGARHARAWHTPTSDVCDFFDLKGIVETILERLNIAAKLRFVPLTDDPRLHPGRSARLVSAQDDAQSFGVLGELHPQVRERLGLSLPRVPVAELNLGELLLLAESPRYRSISRFPAISQDLAVIVDQNLAAARVDATIRKYAGPQLESVLLFDVYTGPQIGDGKRSLAYRLTFRAPDRTLSDNDIAKVRAKIIRGLEFDLKATIRG